MGAKQRHGVMDQSEKNKTVGGAGRLDGRQFGQKIQYVFIAYGRDGL